MTTPNEQPVSDTPRTDENTYNMHGTDYVEPAFARQLERELNQANEKLDFVLTSLEQGSLPHANNKLVDALAKNLELALQLEQANLYRAELVRCKERCEALEAELTLIKTSDEWRSMLGKGYRHALRDAEVELDSLRAKVQELEGLGQSFREFCLMNPDKVHDVPDDVWIPFSQGFKSAFTIDNAREGK